MSITFIILKLDKSNEVKELQFLNIEFIALTFEVLKLEKSKDVNNKQPSNI